MKLGIELFVGRGNERREADAPHGFAAGVLKIRDGFGKFRLAGSNGGGVQRKNMIEDAHENLQPLRFAAVQFFNFQTQRGFFAVVHLLHELVELPDFRSHFIGDLPGGVGSFSGFSLKCFLDDFPTVRDRIDLAGKRVEVLDFFADRAEGVDFKGFFHRAIIQIKWDQTHHGSKRDADGGEFPMMHGLRRAQDKKIREAEHHRIDHEKRPLRNFPQDQVICIFHRGQFCGNARQTQFAFSSTNYVQVTNHLRVATCVIFNPAARGEKARRFRHQLDVIGATCALKATTSPGNARRLAAEAVTDGFDLIVAAGGDGTVNEVLNGIGDAPDGFASARLGVLPLGTVNVFARELKIPARVEGAWKILQRGHELKIDLPCVEFFENGAVQKRYFCQLAGAGLDARAIELVDWQHKKQVGPLAYVIAGLKALCEKKPLITVQANGQSAAGELILAGNGRFYGGSFAIFQSADLCDGRLDICIFPHANFWTMLRSAPGLLLRGKLPADVAQHLSAETFELTSEPATAFELDGEWVGKLPVTFFIEREKLRVIVPPP
jgi:diacylglycerol kinase (ATP)